MKVLVLGAGATGGYFGGRLAEAGRDVSFLVRERRAGLLRANGLVIRSPQGNARLKVPVHVVGNLHHKTFDLVVLACKAYDLDSALTAIKPAVGPETAILPLLNGLRHFEQLDERFGAERVLGGLCSIAVTLDSDGAVEHLSPMHVLRYGERDGSRSARIAAIDALVQGAKADARNSPDILQALWEKWIMLASLAGMTCLMRASVGEIVAAPEGAALMNQMLDECSAIAAAYDHAPRPAVIEGTRKMLTEPGSHFTASMLRDIEHGGRVEADHIVSDLIARGAAKDLATPLLRIACTHLKAYEARLKRKQ
ncbi:MAG: 2-dehydropantoate 2-reductase [Nevskia sp.]